MSRPQVVFAGSFLGYSALILERLIDSPLIDVIGVITTPPQPSGRSKVLTPTPVHQLALDRHVPVFTPSTLDEKSLTEIEAQLGRPEFLITTGYGKLVPPTWLAFPQVAALNLHFSLLPNYRGANPAEWALLRNESTSGVTLIEMSPTFDTGKMIAQSSIKLSPDETRESVYQKLYSLGGDVLPTMIETYAQFRAGAVSGESVTAGSDNPEADSAVTFFLPPIDQGKSPTPYARRLVRDDGFIGWTALRDAQAGGTADSQDVSPKLAEIWQTTEVKLDAAFIERAIRALAGFPGVWTMVETAKGLRRLKIGTAHLENGCLVLDTVQLEGQAVSTWDQVKSAVKG